MGCSATRIIPAENARYMYGQGFGTLFLASVYGEEDDDQKRRKLEKLLSKAVMFICKAQTNRGGWGYLSALDDANFDEGSVTVTQLQASAARNAGIYVPKETIDKAVKYLRNSTTPQGGIVYSLAHGDREDRPGADGRSSRACAFSAGKYDNEYAKKWIKFCKENIPFGSGHLAHDEYQNYYFSQCVYVLGDDGYKKLFPGDKNRSLVGLPQIDVRLPQDQSDRRWQLESGIYRHGLHNFRQPDDFAAGKRHIADLSEMNSLSIHADLTINSIAVLNFPTRLSPSLPSPPISAKQEESRD